MSPVFKHMTTKNDNHLFSQRNSMVIQVKIFEIGI